MRRGSRGKVASQATSTNSGPCRIFRGSVVFSGSLPGVQQTGQGSPALRGGALRVGAVAPG